MLGIGCGKKFASLGRELLVLRQLALSLAYAPVVGKVKAVPVEFSGRIVTPRTRSTLKNDRPVFPQEGASSANFGTSWSAHRTERRYSVPDLACSPIMLLLPSFGYASVAVACVGLCLSWSCPCQAVLASSLPGYAGHAVERCGPRACEVELFLGRRSWRVRCGCNVALALVGLGCCIDSVEVT